MDEKHDLERCLADSVRHSSIGYVQFCVLLVSRVLSELLPLQFGIDSIEARPECDGLAAVISHVEDHPFASLECCPVEDKRDNIVFR